MIQLLLFLTLGAVLFVFLIVLARRGKAEGGGTALVEARQALFTLQTDLLPPAFVSRIFARDDLEFVRSQRSPALEDLFLTERRRIALQWVDGVREQVALLRQLHLGSARFYARLEFKTEVRLALDFLLLSLSCRLLHVAFLIGGAYAMPGTVTSVAGKAGRVCEVSQRSLAFLTRDPDSPRGLSAGS